MTARASRAGYALPVVLAVVAVLALVLLSAASAVAGLGAAARAAVDGSAFQARAMSAEARALVQAATTPFAGDGLQVGGPVLAVGGARPRSRLRLDGRAYAWGEPAAGLRVSLQDEAGLLNLDASRPDTLMRLFARLGLTALEAETLRDRLLDALDPDADRRPRGAEAPDYAARGLPAPRPGGFDGLAEVGAVMDWPARITGPRRRALEAWAGATPGVAAFNVNTAPPEVLALVLNLGPAQVERVVARREAAPIARLAELGLGLQAASEPVRPSGRVRFTITDARRGMRYTSRLAPSAAPAGPPWSASSFLLSRAEPRDPGPDAPAFPDPTGPAAPR